MTSRRTLAILSRIELMFQVIMRSVTGHPMRWAEERTTNEAWDTNQSNRCDRSWGAKTTAPGRGGRPGACMSEAFGGNRTHRGDRPVLKRASTLSASEPDRWGRNVGKQLRDSRMSGAAKMHAALRNQRQF